MGDELRAAKALADDHFRNAQRLAARLSVAEDALRWVRDHCRKLRLGTDDWFDLVEIESACTNGLGAAPHLPVASTHERSDHV